jgi:HK97 family phage prohead protease
MAIERRASTGEIRAVEDGKERRITGYAAVFDSLSESIGGFARGAFKEKIDRNAFANCLRSEPNVVCLANHDPQWILGRTPRTLSLTTDNTGLRYTCSLPDTQQGNSIWEAVRRKDIVSSSFGFTAEDDSWSDDNVRTLRQVMLHDVSCVTFPAYRATTCSVRSAGGAVLEIPLGWYRMGKLPLTSQSEMRARVKALRQEMGRPDAEDDDGDCTCECAACQNDDCENCDCDSTECTGTNCGSESSQDCHCFTTREVAGRQRRPEGKTIHAIDRWALQQQRELEQKIFDAKQLMKWRLDYRR